MTAQPDAAQRATGGAPLTTGHRLALRSLLASGGASIASPAAEVGHATCSLRWSLPSSYPQGVATIGAFFAGLTLLEFALPNGARQRMALVALAAQPVYWLYVVGLIRREGWSKRPRRHDKPA